MNITDYKNFLSDDKVVIFLLHGVITEKNNYCIRNYNNKHITKSDFHLLIKSLSDYGKPVSMNDIIRFCEGEKPVPKSFAITFDDGFHNNYINALPILINYNVPVTIYITTDFIDSNKMSWIDRIEWAFENISNIKIKLPFKEDISIASTNNSKIELLDNIRYYVKNNKSINPNLFADLIQKELNLPLTYSGHTELDRKLSWSEVAEINKNPIVTIGGHTHTHNILSYLTDKKLEKEIKHSLYLIKKNTGISVNHYSYPEGLDYTYDQRVIYHLKKNGILCCPSAQHGLININDNPFKLKRITVV